MTQQDIEQAKADYDTAAELIDELHTERLAYSEYVTLRNGMDSIPALIDEVKRMKKENAALKSERDVREKALEIAVDRWCTNLGLILKQTIVNDCIHRAKEAIKD